MQARWRAAGFGRLLLPVTHEMKGNRIVFQAGIQGRDFLDSIRIGRSRRGLRARPE